jgi:chaperonin GroEL
MGKNYREITEQEELTYLIDEVLLSVGQPVTSTMGPYGHTVILTNRFKGPYTTKDGVSVIKAIGFKHPVKDEIAKLIKEVAERTLKIAGDGTTTAVCLLHSFMYYGRRELQRGVPYLELLGQLNQIEKYTIGLLEDMSEELQDENIYDVATISANGDMVMGKIIEEAFQHSHNVKVEYGIESYDKVDKVNGMVLKTGYLDQAFVNLPERDSIIYERPKVLIIDGKLNDLKLIGNILQNQDGPFLIIADDISPNVSSILRENYNRGALAVALMKTPGFGGHRKNLVKDLEKFTGAESVRFDTKTVKYGLLDSIELSREKAVLTKTGLSDECKRHAEALKTLRKNTEEGQSKELLDQRIENLIGDMSIIKVGGVSDVEVTEKYDRYDDAVRAVSCALEDGIVPGGGQALAIVKERLDTMINSSLTEALMSPMQTIEANSSFHLKIRDKDMMKEKIFDPTKVTKTAFKNALSVAKQLLNTSNLILDRSLWT